MKLDTITNVIPFTSPKTGSVLQKKENNLSSDKGENFPIVDGIARFVKSDNYAEAFGIQWNEHRKTQLDSFTKQPISEVRLERCLGFPLKELKGKNILEAGSGAGRFTEVLAKYGANVYTFDFSHAVEANKMNNGSNENVVFFQADIREIPFPDMTFDIVLCLGVVQHTPNSEQTIKCLYGKVKPGGKLVFDHYRWLKGHFTSLYLLWWQILKRIPTKTQFKVTNGLVNFFFPIHWRFRDNKFVQIILRRFSPIAFYHPAYKLSRELHFAWSKLDTHDRTTDHFKHHRNVEQITTYLKSLGATDIEASKGGNGVEARCTKPA